MKKQNENTEVLFNKRGRKRNAVLLAIASLASNILIMLIGFAYRTVFLRYLSSEYLGIAGLFSNILQVLSLADIGFFSVITYRLYEPISCGDVAKLNALMRYLKKIFLLIVISIFVAGIVLLPFIGFFISDTSKVPSDINLKLIYFLFLLQTIISYIGVYRQCLLIADQKKYIQSLFLTLFHVVQNVIQIFIIIHYNNYTLSLLCGLTVQLVYNILLSLYVTIMYKPVFMYKEELGELEKTSIKKDSFSYLTRKIGYVVLYSTDSIVISKFLGLVITGIFSNYILIVNYIQNIVGQVFESFISSIGNAQATVDKQYNYTIYSRIVFIDLWLSSVFSVCTAVLINDFIVLWVGDSMLLDRTASLVLSLQLFIIMMNKCNTSFIEGCGLFIYDKYRPLSGALVNLTISVLLVTRIGITGVFWGTIIAQLFINFWRDVYILHKYEFNKSVIPIIKLNLIFLTVSIVEAFVFTRGIMEFGSEGGGILSWIIHACIVFVCSNIFLVLLFYGNEHFNYYKALIVEKITIKKTVI